MTLPRIYLDKDGVFSDFMTGQHIVHDAPYDINNYPYELGQWDVFPMDNCPITWESANERSTEEFWANLPWMPGGQELYCGIMKYVHRDSVTVLTRPMMNPGSFTGKARWVRKNMKSLYTRLNMTYCSKGEMVQGNPQSLLIDDIDKNVDEFRDAGGEAILVPRPWNRHHGLYSADETAMYWYVINRLRIWLGSVDYRKDNYGSK